MAQEEVWFQLVQESEDQLGLIFASLSEAAVEITSGMKDVRHLRQAIRAKYRQEDPDILEGLIADQLRIYNDKTKYKAKEPCSPRMLLDKLDAQTTLIVEVPKPRTDVVASSFALPSTSVLNEPDKFAEECTAFQAWEVGVVHEIPSIWEFMKPLGGCTTNGKVFWREEDKQVVSILVDGWFREPTPDNINMLAKKKSILMGSPGIGKSTLLCVMAFYLVFKHRKNVVVYRQLTNFDEENCLFYLGYEEGKIVQFAVQSCKAPDAINIYEELIRRQYISNVWLLLDGFLYRDIPEGVRTFKMLATSQQVDLKSQELDGAYTCLLPCWRKEDLFTLGREVYTFEEEDMDGRFYISGGSVREFGRATLDAIQTSITNACAQVEDASILFSHRIDVQSKQVDRVRHTFVQDVHVAINYLSAEYWHQVVDSEFAILYLSRKIRSQDLLRVYHWARGAGHHSLAGCVFEICLHRLGADNNLILQISEYDTATSRKSSEERPIDMKRLEMKKGIAQCSESATTSTQCEKELEK